MIIFYHRFSCYVVSVNKIAFIKFIVVVFIVEVFVGIQNVYVGYLLIQDLTR